MIRFWRALAVVIAGGLLSVVLTAGAAVAAPPRPDDECLHNPSSMCDPPEPGDSDLLPVNRWGDATGRLHGRLGDQPWEDMAEKIQRNGTYPVLISMGNAMWSGATSMTSAAIRMDILDAAGATADHAAAALGSSLMSSGIVALLAVIAIVVPAWRAARGQGQAPWGAFFKTAAIVGLFAAMLAGAQASTTTADGHFEPGRMSPGWWVKTVDEVVAAAASAPAAALMVQDTGAGFAYDESAGGPLSCQEYVAELKETYSSTNPITRMESSIPLVMSGMWEATGLRVWATSQFGANNPYGDFAYCRLLEQYSGTSVAEQRSTTFRASEDETVRRSNLYSLAWQTSTNNQEDRTMIAWAQCRPDGSGGWKLAPGWEKITGDNKSPDEAREDCEKWWTTPAAFNDEHGSAFDDADSAFDFSGTDVIRRDAGDSSQAQDFLLTLQGRTGFGVTTSLAMVYSYVFSSLIMMVVFGIIALGIIIAKVAAIVMMIAVFFAMLLSLWPGGGKGSVGKYLGQYVGMSLFVFGMQLIFAFLTLLTSMMVQAGAEMFGDGSLISMIWTGFAPVISVVLIHMVFTKFLKLPSPFSMTGAQQWGSAAAGGAVGGAIGAGVMSRMNRMRMRSEYALMRSGERAGARALGVVSGGRFGRRGRGPGRAGMLVGAGAASGSAAAQRGRRAAMVDQAPAEGQPEATKPGFLKSRLDPDLNKQRKDAKGAATTAAAARGGWATVQVGKRTVRTPYAEGLAARLSGVRDQFEGKTTRERWGVIGNAARRGAAAHLPDGKTAAKVAGLGALTVATGGMALPVMGAVWGKNQIAGHVGKTREAQRQAVGTFEARQAADELARASQVATPPVGAGFAHVAAARRANGESVSISQGVTHGVQSPGSSPVVAEPAAGAARREVEPRRGERPFGRVAAPPVPRRPRSDAGPR